MPSADATDPPPAADLRPRRRLYASISPAGLVTGLGIALVFSFGRVVQDLLVSIRDHQLLDWTLGFLGEFAGHAMMVLVIVAVVGPAMSLGAQGGWRRARDLAIALVLAVSIAAVMRIVQVSCLANEHDPGMTFADLLQRFFIRFFVRYGYLALLFVVAVEFYRYEARSIEGMHDAEVDRLALDREMAAARLQVLQAQIEPHFLFNTLANVRRLYQTSTSSGRDMLDNLMRYLEVALPRMRDESSTLERESSLIQAFLGVQKIRMGRRLSFEIDIPTLLGPLKVPPMMLLTLVENALKHGINPLPEGGTVRVEAKLEGERLEVSVSDSGRGFGEGTSGGGTGLANVRTRLGAIFGGAASLDLFANVPRGVTARLSMPAATDAP